MRRIKPEILREMIKNHETYLSSGFCGERFNILNVNLKRQDLRNANLSKANLKFADFSYSDLRGVKFNDAELFGATFKGVTVDKDFDREVLIKALGIEIK